MAGGGALRTADTLVREYDMLPPGTTVLCAVSGGADSMCLLHYLSGREDLTLHAAHFDHQLRGAESERDARFVRDWCRDRGIPFHLGTGDVAGTARSLGRGIEETARQLRYGFLFETALSLGAGAIATAHNADDNVETVLLHLIRGTGLTGLTGIAPRRGKLIRPLLTTPRRDIEDYLQRHHIPHVEDSTNQKDDFTRNKIRHQLVPMIEAWAPGFRERMTQTIPRLRRDDECLGAQARQLFRQACREGGDLILPAPELARSPRSVALRAIRLLLAEAAEGDTDCTAAHLEAILALCRSEHPSGQVSLPRGLTARREYGKLILTRDAPPPPLEPLFPVQGENPIPGTLWTLVLDVPPWPGLTVRSRQSGDAVTLPGRPNKRLKELFIDAKLPRWERRRIPVAADGDGVLAVAGFGANTAHPRSGQVRFMITEQEDAV